MNQLPFFTLNDFDLVGKSVLLRVDINSPIDPRTGNILDDARFRAHLETIEALSKSKIAILAHQSRPGKNDFVSLKTHASHLSNMLKRRVKFLNGVFDDETLEEIDSAEPGDILMLENTRFFSEEVVLAEEKLEMMEKTHIVKNLASHADYFVNDAFAAAHRSNVTLVGFSEVMPNIAGKLMENEIIGIERFFAVKGKNRVGIFGGAKADDSIKIIDKMLKESKLDKVITGGLVGHIFLVAGGMDMGKKNEDVLRKEIGNYEKILKEAEKLLDNYRESILTPVDFIGNEDGKVKHYKLGDFRKDIPAMDIGVDTIAAYASIIKYSDAVIVNGPMGVFELEDFAAGTEEIFSAVAKSSGYKVAGGGHTLAALERMGIRGGDINHISTGGGALISYLAGEPMPGIESLIVSKKKFGGS
ncbi:MAG: phosphoglycerate kinase [Thermoplasmatales archaeon]|nr:phosphoglycerate kinase [Candidatus Thermoplasmatota archaeon]MCL6002995.1 phosphoglycerate kinase [Candidatus Thermoplasmatota archaeon]MDA8054497.1 phosphoglycerate kinase [Thermoplasmatales archaeon]